MATHPLLILVASLCCAGGTLFSLPAIAETPLTQATVQRIQKRVELYEKQKQERPARKDDVLNPGDALRTYQQAMAELRFNDRSLARIGEQAVFRFEPNSRSFDLQRGTVLLLIQPGQGRTRVRTPNAAAGIRGSALFIRYMEDSQVTMIGALTNSDIEISNNDGKTVVLKAGQLGYIYKDQIGVYNFDQKLFQETSPFFKDINWEEAPGAVKEEIEAALQGQQAIAGKYEDSPDWTKLAENRSTSVAQQVVDQQLMSASVQANLGRMPAKDMPGIDSTTRPSNTGVLRIPDVAISQPPPTAVTTVIPTPPSSISVTPPSTPSPQPPGSVPGTRPTPVTPPTPAPVEVATPPAPITPPPVSVPGIRPTPITPPPTPVEVVPVAPAAPPVVPVAVPVAPATPPVAPVALPPTPVTPAITPVVNSAPVTVSAPPVAPVIAPPPVSVPVAAPTGVTPPTAPATPAPTVPAMAPSDMPAVQATSTVTQTTPATSTTATGVTITP